MAGHGYHMTSKSEIARRPCKCTEGFVVTYEEEWESDWAGDKVEISIKCECLNRCE